MNGMNLEHKKSLLLFNVSGEAKKMKAIARNLLKESKGEISAKQRKLLKSQAKDLIDGANMVLKQARLMHFKGATPETIEHLNEISKYVTQERKDLEKLCKLSTR